MKLYLSSFKLGQEKNRILELAGSNLRTAYISNALDFADGSDWQVKFTQDDIDLLKELGLEVENFDLRKYFDGSLDLEKALDKFGVIWVSGGNVFVLRQAMHLSGFDKVLKKLWQKKANLLYGGYSAGVCVLTDSLKGLDLVDSVEHKVYGQEQKIIWEGLGLLDYAIVPHYNSEHPESSEVGKVAQMYEQTGVKHHKLRDGETIIVEQ